jgi:hypothetical protein
LKALRYGSGWEFTRYQIKTTLESFLNAHRELILIGPSAGYLLPKLSEHTGVRIDFDVTSQPLFFLRHGANFKTIRKDLFPGGELDCDFLRSILRSHPKAGILFCNILGQMPLQYFGCFSNDNWKNLNDMVMGRSFASIHDRMSGPAQVGLDLEKICDFQNKPSLDQLATEFKLSGEWVDHETSSLFEGACQFRYVLWPISKKRTHLLEISY